MLFNRALRLPMVAFTCLQNSSVYEELHIPRRLLSLREETCSGIKRGSGPRSVWKCNLSRQSPQVANREIAGLMCKWLYLMGMNAAQGSVCETDGLPRQRHMARAWAEESFPREAEVGWSAPIVAQERGSLLLTGRKNEQEALAPALRHHPHFTG